MRFMPGKGRATGYSDYYKNNGSTPGTRQSKMEEESEDDPRKKALKKRLQRIRRNN